MLEQLADPNLAFLLLVAGAFGIYWELYAPGGIFPGLIGAFLLFAGSFGLWEDAPTWYGAVLLLLAFLLFAIELKFGAHGASAVLGAVLLSTGAIALLRGPHRINPAIALAVSTALCMIAVSLGYLGLRARRSAILTGLETLVGEWGIARTEIDTQGTVFIRGEYWQAKSAVPISSGKRVSVERVHGLTLYVKEA